MMESTRPTPPWVPANRFTQTFVEKNIIVRVGFADAPPPGVLNVEYAREYIYSVPSDEWDMQGDS